MCVKGALQDWDASSLTWTPSESWVLSAGAGAGAREAEAFQHLLVELSAHALHAVSKLCVSPAAPCSSVSVCSDCRSGSDAVT